MSTLELRAYEIFKNKFGEKEAEVVIEYFDSKAEEKYTQKKDLLLTKDDKIQFASKIEEDKGDFLARIDGVNLRVEEVKLRIEEVNTGLISRIENTRTEMIKWMFIFWIGTVGVLSGLMITLFNVYLKH